MKLIMFSGGGHPYESKYYLFVYITQCVPLVGCKFTIPESVVNLSSLMYIPVGFNLSMSLISFIFTLEVASFFGLYFSTNYLNDKY